MPVDVWLPTRRLMAENDRWVAARMAWGGRGKPQGFACGGDSYTGGCAGFLDVAANFCLMPFTH